MSSQNCSMSRWRSNDRRRDCSRADMPRRARRTRSQELHEVPDHRRVRVREDNAVAAPRAFCPEQHASGDVIRVIPVCDLTADRLELSTLRKRAGSVRSSCRMAVDSWVATSKRPALILGELDVPCPGTHRRERTTHDPRDLLHGSPFARSSRALACSTVVISENSLETGSDESGWRESNPRCQIGSLGLCH